VARLLRAAGRDATIVRVAGGPADGDAAVTLDAAVAAGVPIAEYPDGGIDAELEGVDLIVDALLGTGVRGAPEGRAATAITAMNGALAPVLALDVPSGIDASTGMTPGVVVTAEGTVTFHVDKVGLNVSPGREQAGFVIVVPIGIPDDESSLVEACAVAVADASDLVPQRTTGGSKYAAGSVLVVGGAPGMSGAPALSAAAALRAGAGLVHCAVPISVQPLVASWAREVMVHAMNPRDPTAVLGPLVERVDAIAVGPGLGRDADAGRIVDVVCAIDRPLIIDADALWWLRGRLDRLRSRKAPTVLTPHAGEAARLLGITAGDLAARRLEHAQRIAAQSHAVVLLKGADTIVIDPGGRIGIRDGACAGLATAGSGDVLTGVIAAIAARGVDGWTAAVAGAAVHLEAARRAEAQRPGGAIMAGDLIEGLRADNASIDRRRSTR
jgi:NAD(P)H-hydrate epimerase